MLNSDAICRLVDRHLLERMLGLTEASVSQWEYIFRQARDPRVRELVGKAVAMQRRAAGQMKDLLSALPGLEGVGR